jgi:hypothetical protein
MKPTKASEWKSKGMKTVNKEFWFGTWSVRTMLRPGSIKEFHK